MLSDCQDCQYFQAQADEFTPCFCAVNPIYREKTAALRTKLTAAELSYFANDLPHCPDWERSNDLELLTHELTLTRAQWKALAETMTRQGLTAALPEDLRQGESEASGEIAMVEVESSNIAAIGFSAEICQVDFHSGTRYRYFGVPEWVYQNFLEAGSKGRYLNEVFKTEYAFEYEQMY